MLNRSYVILLVFFFLLYCFSMLYIKLLDLPIGLGQLVFISLIVTVVFIVFSRVMAFLGHSIDKRIFILRTRRGCAQIHMAPLASVMKLNSVKVKKYNFILLEKLQQALESNANKIIVNSHLLNLRRIDKIKKRLTAANPDLNLSYYSYQKDTRIIDEVNIIWTFFLTEWRVINVGTSSYIFEIRKV
ncbi:hypothetical protein D3C81_131450 [compost metagenome]